MNSKIGIKKIKDKCYEIKFDLINNKIDSNLIDDFSLITMLFNLNKDHFIDGTIQTLNNDINQRLIMVLVKPICKEFGINQRYIFLDLSRSITNKVSYITGSPGKEITKLPLVYQNLIDSPSVVPTPLANINFTIDKTQTSSIKINIVFTLDDTFYSFPMFDTIIKSFLKNIFKKLQQAYSILVPNS